MEKEREEDDFQAFRWKNVDGELVKDAEKLRPYDELDPLEDVTIEGLTFLGVDDKSGKWCLGGGEERVEVLPRSHLSFFPLPLCSFLGSAGYSSGGNQFVRSQRQSYENGASNTKLRQATENTAGRRRAVAS